MAEGREYTIVVEGYISERLVSRLSEINEKSFRDGNTNIKVNLKDQAALFSLIKQIRDTGLTLLLIERN